MLESDEYLNVGLFCRVSCHARLFLSRLLLCFFFFSLIYLFTYFLYERDAFLIILFTSMQFWPSPYCLLGPPSGHKIVLRMDMTYGSTCRMRAYVLRKVMLCRRKFFVGGHVLVECMSLSWHILHMFCLILTG